MLAGFQPMNRRNVYLRLAVLSALSWAAILTPWLVVKVAAFGAFAANALQLGQIEQVVTTDVGLLTGWKKGVAKGVLVVALLPLLLWVLLGAS